MHVRVVCLCHARVCTVVLRALSVCTVVHAVPFFARGVSACQSPLAEARQEPHPNPKSRLVPTTK